VVELGLWRDDAQTKRNRHRPWCEDDGAYALGLGVLMPKPLNAMVAAKNEHNLFANRFVGPGMNERRILYNFQRK
jgi:hypothetical protein